MDTRPKQQESLGFACASPRSAGMAGGLLKESKEGQALLWQRGTGKTLLAPQPTGAGAWLVCDGCTAGAASACCSDQVGCAGGRGRPFRRFAAFWLAPAAGAAAASAAGAALGACLPPAQATPAPHNQQPRSDCQDRNGRS